MDDDFDAQSSSCAEDVGAGLGANLQRMLKEISSSCGDVQDFMPFAPILTSHGRSKRHRLFLQFRAMLPMVRTVAPPPARCAARHRVATRRAAVYPRVCLAA